MTTLKHDGGSSNNCERCRELAHAAGNGFTPWKWEKLHEKSAARRRFLATLHAPKPSPAPAAAPLARDPYAAAELFINNAPNVWAVMKRAQPGARQFNGEVMAHCKDETTAALLARLLNEQARGASAVCTDCESINTHSSFCPRYGEVR